MQDFCQLNKPYKGSELKKWMREVAKRYYSSSPDQHKVLGVSDFPLTGSDIVKWMSVYFDTISNNVLYEVKYEDTFNDGKGKYYISKVKKEVEEDA